jgi:hypothetical protein
MVNCGLLILLCVVNSRACSDQLHAYIGNYFSSSEEYDSILEQCERNLPDYERLECTLDPNR